MCTYIVLHVGKNYYFVLKYRFLLLENIILFLLYWVFISEHNLGRYQ